MRRSRVRNTAVAALAAAMAAVTAGCGGGTAPNTAAGSDTNPKELTYWASNQGTSIQNDQQVLTPQLKKFQQRTGIRVKLEVIPWDQLLSRILAAASSGQGPDVLNIGNTWAASLQSTNALMPWTRKELATIGGAQRFSPTALASTGAKGRPPAAVPLYSMAYGLYWNKKLLKQAGIAHPPTTWDELAADGKKLTKGDVHGIAVEGSDVNENAHHAFILGRQHGADFFDAQGRPDFASPGAVAAVKTYVDLLGAKHLAAPGNAEYAKRETIRDFATGKAAMMLWQNAAANIKSNGMRADEYGVAPVPVQSAHDQGKKATRSMVAGIDLAVFKNTDNRTGALKFVKFMTSDEEQRSLNATYGAVPPVRTAQRGKAFSTGDLKVLRQVLDQHSAPLPQVPDESKFEQLVGTAVKDLFADAAAGKPVTTASVRKRLTAAQQQMGK